MVDGEMRGAKRGMHPHLGITIELQREEIARIAAKRGDFCGGAALGAAPQQQTSRPPGILDRLIIGAVRAVMRKAPHLRRRCEVIEDVLACAAAKAAWHP